MLSLYISFPLSEAFRAGRSGKSRKEPVRGGRSRQELVGTAGWLDACMNGWKVGRPEGWMDGWLDRWMDGCLARCIGGCLDERIDGCTVNMDAWRGKSTLDRYRYKQIWIAQKEV